MHYERSTEGIRVRVRPSFSLSRSRTAEGQYVFPYQVELENHGDEAGRLLYRFWRIHDSIGEDSEIDGEGVVGEQPHLAPGDRHEYRSFCILQSTVGWMEGYYTFERPDGRRFRVEIPRFQLDAPIPPLPPVDPATIEADDAPDLMN